MSPVSTIEHSFWQRLFIPIRMCNEETLKHPQGSSFSQSLSISLFPCAGSWWFNKINNRTTSTWILFGRYSCSQPTTSMNYNETTQRATSSFVWKFRGDSDPRWRRTKRGGWTRAQNNSSIRVASVAMPGDDKQLVNNWYDGRDE